MLYFYLSVFYYISDTVLLLPNKNLCFLISIKSIYLYYISMYICHNIILFYFFIFFNQLIYSSFAYDVQLFGVLHNHIMYECIVILFQLISTTKQSWVCFYMKVLLDSTLYFFTIIGHYCSLRRKILAIKQTLLLLSKSLKPAIDVL